MSSPDSHILYLSEARKAQYAMLHPRSNHDGHSRFVDPHANGFQMPPHFDQYNPATWPTASATHESAHGMNTYYQQPPNPAPSYGDAHALGWAHHGGKEVIPPPHGRGNESSTSVRYCPPVSQTYPAEPLQRNFGQYTREMAPPVFLPSPTPTNYIVVPQESFSRSRPMSILLPSIEFMPKGWHVHGVNLPCRLSAEHNIENPHDRVFILSQGITKEIIIKIQWPGYPVHPFEIHIGTKNGNISRGELLDLVCRVVMKFSAMLKERKAHVLAGNRMWAIGKTGLDVDRFFIARLVHRGGDYFQPEIWVPRPHEK